MMMVHSTQHASHTHTLTHTHSPSLSPWQQEAEPVLPGDAGPMEDHVFDGDGVQDGNGAPGPSPPHPMPQAVGRCKCTLPGPHVGPKGDYIGHYACLPEDSTYRSDGTLPGEDGSVPCRLPGSTSVDGGAFSPELLKLVREDLICLLGVRGRHPGTPIAMMDNILQWYQKSAGISPDYAAVLKAYAPTYNKAMGFISSESCQVGFSGMGSSGKPEALSAMSEPPSCVSCPLAPQWVSFPLSLSSFTCRCRCTCTASVMMRTVTSFSAGTSRTA